MPREERSASASSRPAVPLHRQPAFALFWLARFSSNISNLMLTVAVGWQMYELTSSPLDLGFIGLAQFLPAVGLMLLVGHVADRYDRRLIVCATQVFQAVVLLGVAATSAAGMITPTVLYIVVVSLASARAFETPTMQALLPTIVSVEDFPRAVAASSSAMQTAVITGPAIGGFAYLAGPGVVYALCALLVSLAAICVMLIRGTRRPAPREPVSYDTVMAGIRYVRENPLLLGAISLDMFAVLLGGATALLPIFARDILEVGPSGLGMLRAAPGVGALSMALWLANWPLRGNVGRKMFAGVALFAAATIVFGLSTSFLVSLAALVVLGASDMISVVIRLSLVQLATPDAMRGRVSAVNALFIGTSNQLGEFESGVTAAWFGTRAAVVLGGVGTLVVLALWRRWFPALYGHDRLDEKP